MHIFKQLIIKQNFSFRSENECDLDTVLSFTHDTHDLQSYIKSKS